MQENTPKSLGEKGEARRRFLRGFMGFLGFSIISVDWPKTIEAIASRFRDPSIKAQPVSVPKDQPIYRLAREEMAKTPEPETLYESAADYLRAAQKLQDSQSIDELRRVSQQQLFNKIGGQVAFGGSNQRDKWELFATKEAERISGLPVERLGGIEAYFGTPSLEQAKYAVLRTQAFAAALPMGVYRAINLTECGYVAGMGISTPMIPNHTIDNGASDTVHRAVMVDCLEGEHRRAGVGKQWLRQSCMVLDAVISRSPTTFNDMEFAQIMPGLEDISQHRLDFPARDDTAVFDIASTKAERFTEILSGELILPGDAEFESPEQVQQELLLRRLYGTFDDIPSNYFEDLTVFRRTHDKKLPTCGAELVA